MGLTDRFPSSPPDAAGGWRLVAGTLLAVLAGFAVLAVAVHAAATLHVRHRGTLSVADRLTATNAARVSLIQLLGGIGLVGGLVFTVRTYSLARHTQRSDRFANAVGQIGDAGSEATRAAGVYTLWLLTREARAYWPVAEQVLAAVVKQWATPGASLGSDVQAALTVLGQRPVRPAGERGKPLDLRAVDVTGADLAGANLERARLDGACLAKANLVDARLTGASLIKARLDGAMLSSADLTSANLEEASLRDAVLYRTQLADADLRGCDLVGSDRTEWRIAGARNVPGGYGP
jgi:hypothetical protein